MRQTKAHSSRRARGSSCASVRGPSKSSRTKPGVLGSWGLPSASSGAAVRSRLSRNEHEQSSGLGLGLDPKPKPKPNPNFNRGELPVRAFEHAHRLALLP